MTTKTFDTFKEMKEMYCDNDFATVAKMQVDSVVQASSLMAYCDYIANLISVNLKLEDMRDLSMLASVGKMQYDLDDNGSFASTKKTIAVEDRYGKKYRITVEEVK